MEPSKLTLKELIARLSGLEISLEYNIAKGDEGSVSKINEEIYKVRNELKTRK